MPKNEKARCDSEDKCFKVLEGFISGSANVGWCKEAEYVFSRLRELPELQPASN